MKEENLDLNNIFHLNVSYNFDLLKSVLENVIQKQKETDKKIEDLKNMFPEQNDLNEKLTKMENQLNGVKDAFSEQNRFPQNPQNPGTDKNDNENKKNDSKSIDENELINTKESPSKRKRSSDLKLFSDNNPLTVSVSYDEITNKIIRKVNSIEHKINEIITAINQMDIDKSLKDLKSVTTEHTIKINEMSHQVEENKNNIEQMGSTLKGLSNRVDELNFADAFAGADAGGDNSKIVNLIGALEKKFYSKTKLTDERLNKLEEDAVKTKTDCTNFKNFQDFTTRNQPNINEKIEKNAKALDEIINKINDFGSLQDSISNELKDHKEKAKIDYDNLLEEIKHLKEQIESQKDELFSHNVTDGNVDSAQLLSINKEIKEMKKNITELDKNLRLLPTELGISSINGNLKALEESLNTKATLDDLDSALQTMDNHKVAIDELKDHVQSILDDQTDHEDLQAVKIRLERVYSKLTELKLGDGLGINPAEKQKIQVIDTSKFIDIDTFHVYQSDISNVFKGINSNFENINRFIDDIFANLKTKTTLKELKTLEDDFTTKLEDIKNSCLKKFADKNETSKNFKYIEQQIKHIIEINIKKSDKGDNWLIAKKNFGHCCASCENYLGDLKDSNAYVPWNKYPMRDPNDKLYRIGNGFSKMLQLVNIDNNSNNQGNERILYSQPTQNDENAKTMAYFHREENKKVLPKIDNKKGSSGNMSGGEDGIEENYEGEEDPSQPKM